MLLASIRRSKCAWMFAPALFLFSGPKPAMSAAVPDAAPNVIYKAYGTFIEPPVSGGDLFHLQGEPFNISVTASAASAPKHSGRGYAVYSPLAMTGTVKSGLLSSPTNISSHSASIELQSGATGESFTVASPIRIVGLQIKIQAVIKPPRGTLTTLYIHPFTAPVTMIGANATLSYTDGTETTVLGINGQLSATAQSNA